MDFRSWLNNDYYNLLGVSYKSTSKEIVRAYKQKAKLYHPDKYPVNTSKRVNAEEFFKIILDAKETLLDPEKEENMMKKDNFYKIVIYQLI